MTAAVRVIIPAWNAERWIGDAISSALSQSQPPARVVVVDDGSGDATAALARGFGERVTVLTQPNRGVSAARNHGARDATEPYLAFLDADDAWHPSKLERQVAEAERTGAALVYSDMVVTDERLVEIGRMSGAPPELALRNSLLMEQPAMTVATGGLVRADAFRAVGGFDERLSTSADTDLACRIAARFPVAHVPGLLASYRQHGSQMHSNPRAVEHDMEIVLREFFRTTPLPPAIAGLERRARASLHVTLALDWRKRGEYVLAASHLARAFGWHPGRAARLASESVRRRLRRR